MNKIQAAQFLGISTSYLEKLMRNRDVPYFKLDGKKGKVMFLKIELLEWVKQHRVTGPETK